MPLCVKLLELAVSLATHVTIVLCFFTDIDNPPSYGFDPEHCEEQQPRHDPLSFSGSPASSPRLRSKNRNSRDTQSSGSLESTQSVKLLPPTNQRRLSVSVSSHGCCCCFSSFLLLHCPSPSSLHAPLHIFIICGASFSSDKFLPSFTSFIVCLV